MKKKLMLSVLYLFIFIVTCPIGSSFAEFIPIANPSFEENVPEDGG